MKRKIIFLIIFLLFYTSCQKTYKVKIGDGISVVPSSRIAYVEFNVPAGAKNVKIKGSFYAAGGSGNDIICYIFNKNDYINWVNGHKATYIWKSEKITAGTIDLNLEDKAGDYIIAFDNTFSILSDKKVVYDIELYYKIYQKL